jgi:hypothetical protein
MSVGMDRGCFIFNQPEINHHMPFLPFLGITFGSLALLKLGALSVLVGVLQSVIAVLLLIIVGLTALLAMRHVKKQ